MLGDEEIGFYREAGYLVVEGVFDEAEVAELRRVTGDFVEASRSVSASNEVYDLDPAHSPERPIVRRIKNPQDRHPAQGAALACERLLDLVAGLIDPDIRLDHGKLNFKPPAGRGAVEWHQDWAFYPHTNDDILAAGQRRRIGGFRQAGPARPPDPGAPASGAAGAPAAAPAAGRGFDLRKSSRGRRQIVRLRQYLAGQAANHLDAPAVLRLDPRHQVGQGLGSDLKMPGVGADHFRVT
jgi:hypothetical protein